MTRDEAWEYAALDACGARWAQAAAAGSIWLATRYPAAVVLVEVQADGTRHVRAEAPEGLRWEALKM